MTLISQERCLFCHQYAHYCKCKEKGFYDLLIENIHTSDNTTMANKQETRGGKREGSGRPKGKPTKTLSYRVPQKLANKIDIAIRKAIKQFQ